ncbi:hypothetical protein BE08_25945 [Sorangium cellulosum]|uniref:PGRS family protein n=1 Tax=Sorangium cellulosum TaxID=56 RepID=A0A150P3P3_SORCE|nr:hypothetical protein BE08_25945 [Sorangium cellulosum]
MRRRLQDRCRGVARTVAVLALSAVGAAGVSGCYADDCATTFTCAPLPGEKPPVLPAWPCDGDPAASPAKEGCGVFVSASSGDDRNPGTKGAPVKTLQHAIGLAAHGGGDGKPPTRRVYACGETFEEENTLPSGVDLWGGRRCEDGDWSYAWSFGGPDEPTVIAPPEGIPLRIVEGDDLRAIPGDDATSMIFGVRAVAADASAPDGKSSIAMILSAGTRATVRDSKIVAGNGKDGEPGEDAPSERAPDGTPGNDGTDACTTDFATGALPVVTVCDDGTESIGGYGGDGGLDAGGDGEPGQPEPAANPDGKGLAGAGAGSSPCTPGKDGAEGADGGRAAGAVGVGYLGRDGWVGGRGEDGKRGAVGQGGGGGGGSKGRSDMSACRAGGPQGGAAGGSGGGGGCGGRGGKGGGYGGSSIGIVALQGSALTLKATEITTGNGGQGGAGGRGQSGGAGNTGGHFGRGLPDFNLLPACSGGAGGRGGRGGDAGGGIGGSSYGVAFVGASLSLDPDVFVHFGQGAQGGLGGNAAPDDDRGQGEAGDAMAYRPFDAPDPGPAQ